MTRCTDKTLYYLPSKVKDLIVHEGLKKKPFPSIIYTHVVFRKWLPGTYVSVQNITTADTITNIGSLIYDLTITDEIGNRLCSIQEFEVKLHGQSSVTKPVRRFDLSYERPGISLATYRDTAQPVQITLAHGDSPVVLSYSRGTEMALLKKISGYSASTPMSIWVTAIDGPDGDCATGFTRALRREYLAWSLRTIVFPAGWSALEIQRGIGGLTSILDNETELKVDSLGMVHVPKITLSLPPSRLVPFQPDLPWSLDNSTVIQVSHPDPATPNDISVLIDAISLQEGKLWGFLGRLTECNTPVVGIHYGPVTNIITTHPSALVPVPDATSNDISGPSGLALAISVIALEPSCFKNPIFITEQVLITHADTKLGQQLVAICTKRGLKVSTLSKGVVGFDKTLVDSAPFGVIISGSQIPEEIDTLSRALSLHGRLFLWNDWKTGLPFIILKQPWLIGIAIRLALQVLGSDGCHGSLTRLEDVIDVKPGELVPLRTRLFDCRKAYILVGGMGSLGLQIAQWLYQVGYILYKGVSSLTAF
jgi:hypothetical protein